MSSWELWAAAAALVAGAAVARYRYAASRDRRRLYWDAMIAASSEALAATDRESVLRPIAAALPKLLEATNAQVLLVDAAEQQLVYAAGARARPRGSLSMSSISGPVTCFRAKETTVVEDVEGCPFISKEWATKRKLKSALYIPIMSEEECVGVVEVEDRSRKRRFDPEHLFVAEHLAQIAELGLRQCDQRVMTEQLHRSEKLTSVSELANAMAAELDEPLREALRLSADSGTTGVAAYVRRAQDAVERLVRFAAPSAGETEEVDLNAVIRRVAADQRAGEDDPTVIKLSLNDRGLRVSADPTHIEQVFQILFRHARHFLKRLDGRSLQVHTAIRQTMAVVSIAPRASAGYTIRRSLAQLPNSEASDSLGFSICQALVDRAGGSLQMDPASSLGFRIDLEYPLARQGDAPSGSSGHDLQRTPNAIRSGPMTALVVEPDERIRRTIVHQLSDQSIRAIPVKTGDEARAACDRMQFDWVFCELSLPQGSGVELYEAVRRGIETFVFIGDSSAFTANPEAFQGPDKAILRKPVDAGAVDALLEELQAGVAANDA